MPLSNIMLPAAGRGNGVDMTQPAETSHGYEFKIKSLIRDGNEYPAIVVYLSNLQAMESVISDVEYIFQEAEQQVRRTTGKELREQAYFIILDAPDQIYEQALIRNPGVAV